MQQTLVLEKRSLALGRMWLVLARIWPILAIVVALFVLRVALASHPLTRDEGAYAYVATHWMAGELPYRDVWDHKPPGIYLTYAAALSLLGSSAAALHILAALIHSVALCLLFFIARRLYGNNAAYSASILYALAVLTLDGPGVNTEIIVALTSIAAFYFLLRYNESKTWWWGTLLGLCFAMGFIHKQVALFDIAALGLFWLWLTWRQRLQTQQLWGRLRAMLATGVAFALPIALVAAYFALNNALDELWFDAFTYNMLYVNVGLRGRIIDGFFGTLAIMQLNPLLWSAALITVMDLARTKDTPERWLPLFWLVGGLLGVFASGHYGLHYYIPVLAPLALLAGKLVGNVVHELGEKVRSQWTQPLALFAIAFLLWSGINYTAAYLFYYRDDSRAIGISFREAVTYLQQHTDQEDLIFIWGKEPQVYFEANRRAASKYINYYPMTRNFYVYPDAEARLTKELTEQEVELLLVELPPTNPIPPPPSLQEIIDSSYQLEAVVGEMEIYRLVR